MFCDSYVHTHCHTELERHVVCCVGFAFGFVGFGFAFGFDDLFWKNELDTTRMCVILVCLNISRISKIGDFRCGFLLFTEGTTKAIQFESNSIRAQRSAIDNDCGWDDGCVDQTYLNRHTPAATILEPCEFISRCLRVTNSPIKG